MAENFSFFDPVEVAPGVWDREYFAQQFTDYFRRLVTTGVMKGESGELKVSTEGNSMITTLNTGVAYVVGRSYENTSPLSHTHDTEVLGKNRIDRIVVRLDLRTESRFVKSFIKKGVASTIPVPPDLQRDQFIYEISLAQVKIIGGQTYINANDVIDERGKTDICPWAGSKILPNFDNEALENLINKIDNMYQLSDGPMSKYYNGDLNNLTDAGLYAISLSSRNRPLEGTANVEHVVLVIPYDSQYTTQIAYPLSTSYSVRKRIRIGSSWGAWVNIDQEVNLKLTSGDVAIGKNAVANGRDSSVAIGLNATVTDNSSIAIGEFAEAGNSGVALGGSTQVVSGSVAIGRNARSLNTNEGVLGNTIYTKMWKVQGSFSVTGTKNFEIPHPNPDKKYTHVIRHGAVESPTPGDTLYRYEIEATEDNQTVELQLPDYFEHLNTNVDVWVNPHLHFGRAFGIVEGDILKVTCEKAGKYKALVIGTRNDDNVQDWYIKGVEREIGESWLGEVYIFEVDEITEISEFGEGIA